MVALKSDMKKGNHQLQSEQAQTIYDQLSPECMELSSEKGSLSWLSVLPLEVFTCTKENSGMHFV